MACARRETLEETGLRVRALGIVAVTNDIFEAEAKHFITLYVACQREDAQQQPEVSVNFGNSHNGSFANSKQVLEPDKCETWSWESWDVIRKLADDHGVNSQLFLPIVNLVRQHRHPEKLVGEAYDAV